MRLQYVDLVLGGDPRVWIEAKKENKLISLISHIMSTVSGVPIRQQ